MINTIFYFPESLTFDQYTNLLDSDTDEGIARRTIVFARQQGKIYNNGKSYGITSSDVQSLINTAKEDLEASDFNIMHAIETQSSEFSSGMSDLQSQIASNIQTAINTAKAGDDEIKTSLGLTNSNVSIVSNKTNQLETRIDGFSEGNNIKYTQALQSVLDIGISNNAAFNNISSRWAVADGNQNLLRWMAAGFASQVSNDTNFATVFSSYQDTVNGHTQNISAIQTKANENEAKLNALANWSNGNFDSFKAGLISSADVEGAMASLIAESSTIRSAITTYVNGNDSGILLSADKIQLSGTTIAERLIAAQAAIGGFSISQNELSGIYDYTTQNGQHLTHHTSILTLSPQGFSTTELTGFASNTTNQILTDGSGFLANGTFNWTQDGTIYGPMVNVADNIEDHAWSFNSNGEINTYKTIKLSAYSDDSYRYETVIEPNNIQLSHINGDVCNINLRSDGVHIDNPVVASGFATINGTGSRILLDNGNTMTFAELKAALDAI